jgi:glycosyltransferase involved in cell wall biosynthesis
LRIVQVAPDFIAVPPEKYGGIERVVADLTDELVAMGHDVFLYALAGSRTRATLIPYLHQADPWEIARFVQETLPADVDLVHDHTHGSVVGQTLHVPSVVCSIHVPWCMPVANPVFMNNYMFETIGGFRGFIVPNGIRLNEYPLATSKENYLLFMGRLIASKGILIALDIAEQTGLPLLIAGPQTDVADADSYAFYLKQVKPRIDCNSRIEYVGEVGGHERLRLLQQARCVLFPSEAEAFGLVVIEALACGTPVMAFRRAGFPELLDRFPELICRDADEMAAKAAAGDFPQPSRLRQWVADQFTVSLMARRYMEVYREVLVL